MQLKMPLQLQENARPATHPKIQQMSDVHINNVAFGKSTKTWISHKLNVDAHVQWSLCVSSITQISKEA